jgi:hypothetical protein
MARLVNAGGELIAEGSCWLDHEAGVATLEPARTPGVIQTQRNELRLELDTGRTLRVSGRAMVMRIRRPERVNGTRAHRDLYRLRLLGGPQVEGAQEAATAGAAREGALAPRLDGGPREFEETPVVHPSRRRLERLS